jgi:prepilin-type N-terminal cleavage/methylation domain-containing protein
VEAGAVNRRGWSLIEISIVMLVLVIVLVVAYSTFLAGDRFFQNESVVRDAQFNIRRILEQMNQEITEGNPPAIWKRTDTTIVGGPNKVLILLSARDPDDPNCFSGVCPQDVHDPASGPLFSINWLAFVVYAPYAVGGGQYELRRYTLKLPAPGLQSPPSTLAVTFTATQIQLGPYGTLTRSGGSKILEKLNLFEIGSPTNPTVDFNNPPSVPFIPTSYLVTLEKRVQITPQNFSNIRMTTTTKGRN